MRIFWKMLNYIKNTNTSTIAVSRKEKTDKNVVKTYLINLCVKSSQTWVKNQIQVPEARRVPQNDSNKTCSETQQLKPQS